MDADITNASINGAACILSATYAHWNRYGNLREIITKNIPKMNKWYKKASPTIEHFIWGFALTTGSYAIGEFAGDIQKHTTNMYELAKNSQYASEPKTYGLTGGISAIIGDGLWEGKQAIDRKEIRPSQFIGTCLGVATGIIANESQNITNYLQNYI